MKTRNSLAFLLHARDYSETSVIASFLTKDFGILNALLKGAKRKGSKFANILSPGSELYISYSDKNALKTIFECEINKQIPIAPKNLKILIYLNELILKIFEKEHDIPVVFKDYDELMSLMTLDNKDEILELSLRKLLRMKIYAQEDGCMNSSITWLGLTQLLNLDQIPLLLGSRIQKKLWL